MKLKYFIILSLALLLQTCAKQTSPTGGPKDEIPPVLVKSDPKNEEINFKGSEINLTFDEFVQLKNPSDEIIITPSIGKKFEAVAKKNKVTLKLNATLDDSTTYSFSFRESIQDITEKNPAKLKLAFSTGPYIDSLSISGNVKEILTDNPVTNYTVALITASDTFNIFKHKATWITLTDKLGNFEIENLKPGKYFIYAFQDRNKNMLVDSRTEDYGFNSENIDLSSDLKSITLLVLHLNASEFKLISSRPTFAYFNIRVSKGPVEYKITSTDETKKIYSKLESDQTTIKVYNTISGIDSLQVRFEATDSLSNKIDSLIYIKFNKEESTKDNLQAKIESAKILESNSSLSAVISFSKPITQFSQDSLYIQADSVKRIFFSSSDLTWNENLTKLTIVKKLELPKSDDEPIGSSKAKTPDAPSKPTYVQHLILGEGAAISIENDSTAQLKNPLLVTKITANAIISTSIKSKENLIVQLINNNFQLIEETSKAGTYNFENVAPGTYMLRIIVDLDKNGKWTPGNFFTKEKAEPVFYYSNAKGGRDFILKANWFVGELLITY